MKFEYKDVNTNKLHDELITAGIIPTLVESRDDTTWVTYPDKTDMKTVDAVITAHDPIPKTPEPTKEELLQAEIVTLKSRLAKIESTATVKAELTAVPIKDDPITPTK